MTADRSAKSTIETQTTGCDSDAFEIIQAAVSDAPASIEIMRRVSDWIERVGPRLWAPDDFPLRAYERYAEAGELFGGFHHGRMVACMLLQTRDPLYWPEAADGAALYLHKLAVDRNAAGQGFGVAMVKWAAKSARQRGFPALRLDTLPTGRLPELYRHQGFELADPGPREFNGRMMVRMELLLH